ncbi:hypothetical protein [Natronococcus sp. A-GB7]|uniref:hypothetical protein n=1 Tax=Natronococcus sp. A-GB7 TaxID=3037649 RepID=UPI00241D9E76|nr:hypothetical protein [Natronococcus sp. A-GB7]MDG5821906.1 hypothetical protein [Natronococcus sp. A-GB7]
MGKRKFSRRTILKSSAVGGSVGGIGLIKPVNATTTVDDETIRKLVERPEVKSITEKVPQLNIQKKNAKVIEELGIITIPTNFGELIIYQVVEGGSNPIEARIDFENHLPVVDSEWPKNTYGSYIGNENGATFQRSPTEQELSSVRTVIGADTSDFNISYTPETGVYQVMNVNANSERVEQYTVEEVPGIESHETPNLEVTKEDIYEPNSPSTQIGCDSCPLIAQQTLLCIQDIQCARCVFATKPIAILGCALASGCVTAGALLNMVADAGCGELQNCLDSCIDAFTSYV